MEYNFWLSGKDIDVSKLPANGFAEENGAYLRCFDLQNGVRICAKIKAGRLYVDVFDVVLNKKYSRFYSGHGGAAFKEEVRQIVTNALQNCLL